MAGGKNYAKRYAQYKPDATNFGKYVDSLPHLKAAWQKIQDDPDHADSQYWIKRGATSKEAFGRAHAAEDSALLGGTYMGATDYDVGTEAWEGLFDDGKTSYEQFLAGGNGNGNGNGDNLIGGTTGGVTSDIIAQDAYAAPAYQDFSEYSSLLDGNEGLLYQPHTAEYQTQFGTGRYNYDPVQLDPWTARTVDWSPSLLDASDYGPKPVVTPAIVTQRESETQDTEIDDGWDDAYAAYGTYPGDPTGRVAKPGAGTPSFTDVVTSIFTG